MAVAQRIYSNAFDGRDDTYVSPNIGDQLLLAHLSRKLTGMSDRITDNAKSWKRWHVADLWINGVGIKQLQYDEAVNAVAAGYCISRK